MFPRVPLSTSLRKYFLLLLKRLGELLGSFDYFHIIILSFGLHVRKINYKRFYAFSFISVKIFLFSYLHSNCQCSRLLGSLSPSWVEGTTIGFTGILTGGRFGSLSGFTQPSSFEEQWLTVLMPKGCNLSHPSSSLPLPRPMPRPCFPPRPW